MNSTIRNLLLVFVAASLGCSTAAPESAEPAEPVVLEQPEAPTELGIAWPETTAKIVAHASGNRERPGRPLLEWDYTIETTMTVSREGELWVVNFTPPVIEGNVPPGLTAIAPRVPFFVPTHVLDAQAKLVRIEGADRAAASLREHIESLGELDPASAKVLDQVVAPDALAAGSFAHFWSPTVSTWQDVDLGDGESMEIEMTSDPFPLLQNRRVPLVGTVGRVDSGPACEEFAPGQPCTTLAISTRPDEEAVSKLIDEMMSSVGAGEMQIAGFTKTSTVDVQTNPITLFPYRVEVNQGFDVEMVVEGTKTGAVEKSNVVFDFQSAD